MVEAFSGRQEQIYTPPHRAPTANQRTIPKVQSGEPVTGLTREHRHAQFEAQVL